MASASEEQQSSTEDQPPASPSQEKNENEKLQKKEKVPAYVNPDRFKTGGAQRVSAFIHIIPFVTYWHITHLTSQDKITDEALQERMARIKEQNEKIKQRRLVCVVAGVHFLRRSCVYAFLGRTSG